MIMMRKEVADYMTDKIGDIIYELECIRDMCDADTYSKDEIAEAIDALLEKL